jgi:hypothetical protein
MLDLSTNKLKTLPETLDGLRVLEHLNVSVFAPPPFGIYIIVT